MNAEILDKIESFISFEDGWSYQEGVAFSRQAVDSAKTIAAWLDHYGFKTLDAFPGLNGEIRVTAYIGNHYLEFTLESTDDVTFIYEIDDQEMAYQPHLNLTSCHTKIIEFSDLCWSESSTRSITTTKTKNGSLALPSGHHQKMEASLFFVKNAHWTLAPIVVSTSGNFMRTLAVNRPYSGKYQKNRCRAIA